MTLERLIDLFGGGIARYGKNVKRTKVPFVPLFWFENTTRKKRERLIEKEIREYRSRSYCLCQ